MKKRTKIFLIILAVILALAAGVTVWQWNNITAVFYSFKYSEEELDSMLEENKGELNSALSALEVPVPRDLTEEELSALENGTITQEEAVEISLGMSTLTEKIEKKKNDNGKPGKGNQSQVPAKANDTTSQLIAKLYVLKSSYMGKLDGLESQAKGEYANTPAAQRTAAWKGSMISKYSSRVAALEGECDAKVEAIISQIKAELSKNGGDMSLISQIRSAYETEKQIKKAYYMNTYLK